MDCLSISEMTTYRWSFEEDVSHLMREKIPALGVWRHKLADYGEEKGVDLLSEMGMKVSSLFWAGGFTGSDGRSYADCMEDAEDAIRLAAVMQAECLVIYTGARAGHTGNHARRLIRGALTELVPWAEDLQVSLAVEPMHSGCAAEWTVLTDLDASLELIQEVGSDHLKLVFDTYHLGHDPAILDRLPEVAPHVALVHLGDAKAPPRGEQNRCRLGDGVLPLKDLCLGLKSNGYQGWFELELFGEELESQDYSELIRHAQTEFDQLFETTIH